MTAIKQEHNHAYGSGCCPHPDCVKHEERNFDKTKAIYLAKKIKTKKYKTVDAQDLADTILRLFSC
jgi:hypothetical protein